MRSLRVAIGPALLLCVCTTVAAPAGQRQEAADGGRTLLAAVVNSQGRPLVDVGLDDFVVTEGGQSREVLDVHVADYPLVVVVDDRAGAAGALDAVKAAARRFVERVGERPIALARLTDGREPLVSLDDDRTVLLARLAALSAATVEQTPPFETIARAAALLKATEAPFSAVVIVAAAPVDATVLVRSELLPQILDSGAAVHVVEVRQQAGGDAAADGDLLHVIATQSRGQFTAIFSPISFPAALDRLADRLAIEMMIQYLVPPGPKAGDVRAGVRIPGARVIGLGVK